MTESTLPPLLSLDEMRATVMVSHTQSDALHDYFTACEDAVKGYITFGHKELADLGTRKVTPMVARLLFHLSAHRQGLDTTDSSFASIDATLVASVAMNVFGDAEFPHRTQYSAAVTRYGYALGVHIVTSELGIPRGSGEYDVLVGVFPNISGEDVDKAAFLIEHPQAWTLIGNNASLGEIQSFIDSGVSLELATAMFGNRRYGRIDR